MISDPCMHYVQPFLNPISPTTAFNPVRVEVMLRVTLLFQKLKKKLFHGHKRTASLYRCDRSGIMGDIWMGALERDQRNGSLCFDLLILHD